LDVFDWEFTQGGLGVIKATMWMRYGLAAGSWCIATVPRHFRFVDETTVYESSNMTELWTDEIVIAGADSGTKLVTVFTTNNNDVWPSHPIDFNVKDIKAPFGY
jgi:hypothetical protein